MPATITTCLLALACAVSGVLSQRQIQPFTCYSTPHNGRITIETRRNTPPLRSGCVLLRDYAKEYGIAAILDSPAQFASENNPAPLLCSIRDKHGTPQALMTTVTPPQVTHAKTYVHLQAQREYILASQAPTYTGGWDKNTYLTVAVYNKDSLSNRVRIAGCNTECTLERTRHGHLALTCQQPACPVPPTRLAHPTCHHLNANKLARWKAMPRRAKQARFNHNAK